MLFKAKRALSCLLTVLMLLTMLPVSAFAVEGEEDLKATLGITNEDITVTEIDSDIKAQLSEAAQDRSWGLYQSAEIVSVGFMGGRIYSACHIDSTESTSQYVTITMDVPTLIEEDETRADGWVVLALVDGELVTYPAKETGEGHLEFDVRLGDQGTDIALSYLTNMPYHNPVGDWGTLTLEPGDVINHPSLGYVREYTLTYTVSENIATYLKSALFLWPFDLTFYLNSTGLKIDAETISFGENDLFELNPDETEKVDDGCYKFTVNVDTEAWKNGSFSNAVGISYAAPNASSLLFEGEMRSFSKLGSIVPYASMMGCVPLSLTVVEPPDDEVTYHKITVTQTDGGEISPRGVEEEVWVKEGEDQTFTITPDAGYEIVDVQVDNKSVGAISRYIFENVNDDNHTISATFQRSGTVTITPADITVYTGGEGYTGVVDGEGQMTTTANGLPEPGYFITLPDWVNDMLDGAANAEDLSDNLVLTYDDGKGNEKEWQLELYGTAAHSTDVAGVEAARYIYRIVPGEGTENTPVRLQLTDPDNQNQIISSDEFVPSSDEQYKAYDMRIYTDEVTADKVTAKITIDDQTYTCKVEGTEGQLVVRGLTGEDITTDIVNSESQLSGSNISALAPAGVTYYVNGSKVEVADKSGVKLLVDDVLSDGVLAAYIEENITSIPAGNYTYEEKYLDLVDTKNGNAYLTLDEGQKMTMYWPVPSNMNTSKNYYIVHFEALDRNYDNMDQELKDTPPTTVAGTSLVTVNGKQYIKFETDSFSPFVLVYEKTTGGGGGGGGTTRYTITAEAGEGGSISPSGRVSVTRGSDKTFTISADDGYVIADVLVDGESVGAVSSYTFENVRANHTIEVVFERTGSAVADPDDTGVSDWLNTEDHNAYLSGYPGSLFGPDNNMTRAEAAQMFYNLLLDKEVPVTTSFTDVPADAWYAKAVNTLASLGMITGVGNNQFEPERSITRAEFTTIAMRFTNGTLSGTNIFPDVNPNDWFYDYVVGSIQYGWINGYPDGTFGPNNTITRAEVTAIVNRMLGRSADEDYVDSHTTDLRQFTDLADTHWAYYDIMEATNTHDYSKSGSAETWRGLHN